jgi:hypothetical protein
MDHRPKLRVGLLLDSALKAFQGEIVEKVQSSEFAQLLLVIDDRGARTSGLVRADHRRRPLLLDLYQRLDRRQFDRPTNPLRATEDTTVLRQIPTIVPRQNRADTIAEIRSHELDVLLYLGGHRLASAARSLARFGVWSLRTGEDASGFDDARFFLDICGDQVVSTIALSVATKDAPDGRIVAKGSFSARRNSWLLNCSQPYWSAVTFVMQKLREISEHGWDRFAHDAPVIDERETARTSPTLTSVDVARWWVTRKLKQLADRPKEPLENHWRIATRAGKSPALADSAAPDLSDFRLHESPPGHYYADPFLIQEAGKHWLFFEDYRYATAHGVLACAEVSADGSVGTAQLVLEQPYHLSYPCLLRESGELYMLPETLGNATVELYRCTRFPDRWEPVKVLLRCRAVDSTLFKQDGLYWLFTSILEPHANGRQLHLFYARDLLGEWTSHPANPLSSDIRFNRGAGAVVSRNGVLFRPSQDCGRRYGYSFSLNQIARLTPEEYSERCALTIEPNWAPGLSGCHTYSICGGIEAIDVAAKLPRSLVAPHV